MHSDFSLNNNNNNIMLRRSRCVLNILDRTAVFFFNINIVIGEEKYIYILQHRDFLRRV